MTAIAARSSHRGSLPAFTGILARRSLRLYFGVTLLTMLLLLVVAWAIDLARYYDQVSAKAAETGAASYEIFVPYLWYRAIDIITRLLPVACFLGLFLAEIFRRHRLETIVLASTGFSPVQALCAIALFGVVAGGVQAGLESYWRPAAVFAQVELGVGQYAARFRRGLSNDPHWFLSDGNAIRALVLSDNDPELRQVELYRGFSTPQLQPVIFAERAKPTGTKNIWLFDNAVECGRGQSAECVPLPDGRIEIELDLAPAQLTYLNVPAFYLPNQPLFSLAEMRSAPNIPDVDLAIWRRWTALFLPGAFALLGASLAHVVWSGRMRSPARVISACFCGYAIIVSVKVFWALGERGALPAMFAASVPIALALAVTAVIQVRRS